MLNINVFNVGHGDSIVIESIVTDDQKNYIVIDSCRVGKSLNKVNPAFEYLKSKKVTVINALVITHFHTDHFTGVEDFLNGFQIKKLFIPPVFSENTTNLNKQIENFKTRARELYERSDDEIIRGKSFSLVNLLVYLSKNWGKVEELKGRENKFRVPDMPEVSGWIYLPLPLIKGVLRKKIIDGEFDIDNYGDANDHSSAIRIDYGGRKILFGGDSEPKRWKEHARQMKRDNVDNLQSEFLKVPHHGSKHNNTKEVYDYILDPNLERNIAFVSANGMSHPHEEFFKLVEDLNIKPYCTNLSSRCINQIIPLREKNQLPQHAESFINNYIQESKPYPCQGDICLTITSTDYSITTSSNLPCPYHFLV
jgi:beta-lactamase superfamily II metal-dependent hydrolase